MNVIIAGGGKLGFALAEDAVANGHDVVMIDRNPSVIERIEPKLDLGSVVGHAAGYEVLIEAGVRDCDVFVAATVSDELNIISAIMAGKLGASVTMARVRNPEFSSQVSFVRDSLGITHLLNPDLEAAREIATLIRFPEALSVETFAGGRISMVELVVEPGTILDGISLKNFKGRCGDLLVCVVRRGETVFVPDGEVVLQAGDHIHVTGEIDRLAGLYRTMGTEARRIRSMLIIGGGRITYYLLALTQKAKIAVKVIETKLDVAEKLLAEYPWVNMTMGDGTDYDFLEDAGLSDYDLVLPLTGIDEENALIAMYAKQHERLKVVTKVNRTHMLPLLSRLGIETMITPVRVTADFVLRQLRSLEASAGQAAVALYRLEDHAIEVSEFYVQAENGITGRPLFELDLQPGVLVASLVREHQVIFPDGRETIKMGDHVVIVSYEGTVATLGDIIRQKR